jgi:hypothetical protein
MGAIERRRQNASKKRAMSLLLFHWFFDSSTGQHICMVAVESREDGTCSGIELDKFRLLLVKGIVCLL